MVAAGVGGFGGGFGDQGADAGDGFGGGVGVGGFGLGFGGGWGAGVRVRVGVRVRDGAVAGGVLCERGDETRVDFGEGWGRGVVLAGLVLVGGLGGLCDAWGEVGDVLREAVRWWLVVSVLWRRWGRWQAAF